MPKHQILHISICSSFAIQLTREIVDLHIGEGVNIHTYEESRRRQWQQAKKAITQKSTKTKSQKTSEERKKRKNKEIREECTPHTGRKEAATWLSSYLYIIGDFFLSLYFLNTPVKITLDCFVDVTQTVSHIQTEKK